MFDQLPVDVIQYCIEPYWNSHEWIVLSGVSRVWRQRSKARIQHVAHQAANLYTACIVDYINVLQRWCPREHVQNIPPSSWSSSILDIARIRRHIHEQVALHQNTVTSMRDQLQLLFFGKEASKPLSMRWTWLRQRLERRKDTRRQIAWSYFEMICRIPLLFDSIVNEADYSEDGSSKMMTSSIAERVYQCTISKSVDNMFGMASSWMFSSHTYRNVFDLIRSEYRRYYPHQHCNIAKSLQELASNPCIEPSLLSDMGIFYTTTWLPPSCDWAKFDVALLPAIGFVSNPNTPIHVIQSIESLLQEQYLNTWRSVWYVKSSCVIELFTSLLSHKHVSSTFVSFTWKKFRGTRQQCMAALGIVQHKHARTRWPQLLAQMSDMGCTQTSGSLPCQRCQRTQFILQRQQQQQQSPLTSLAIIDMRQDPFSIHSRHERELLSRIQHPSCSLHTKLSILQHTRDNYNSESRPYIVYALRISMAILSSI